MVSTIVAAAVIVVILIPPSYFAYVHRRQSLRRKEMLEVASQVTPAVVESRKAHVAALAEWKLAVKNLKEALPKLTHPGRRRADADTEIKSWERRLKAIENVIPLLDEWIEQAYITKKKIEVLPMSAKTELLNLGQKLGDLNEKGKGTLVRLVELVS